MPLYELTATAFRELPPSSFASLQIRERDDLQRLLRSQIEVLGEELYVLAEEFGDWEESRRRIDLLAIDGEANLVVIELKRTNDGGHMDLQAIRYASMVSAMTFERAEQVHAEYLGQLGQPVDEARTRILTFLGWDEPNEELFAPDVRIVLVSEDFGRELTTAVLWLRDREIDIRCVRLRPYKDGDTRFVDVQQIIPLPEANEYQIQLREKEQVGRKARLGHGETFIKFWMGVVALARARRTRHASTKPRALQWIGANAGVRGLSFNYVVARDFGNAELYFSRPEAAENKAIFDQLLARKAEIEAAFGGALTWQRLDDKIACRIKTVVERGGYRSPESDWAAIQLELVEAMIRLDAALKPSLDALNA